MVVIGNSPLEQPLSYKVERAKGYTYRRTWIGHKTAIEGIYATEKNLAESAEVTHDGGGRYTLIATYSFAPGDTETPLETQELDTEIVAQSIFLNETFRALPEKVVNAVRENFENKPQDNTTGSYLKALANIALVCVSGTGGAQYALAKDAYDLLVAGTESFENYSFTMTRTRTCSRQYSQKIPLSDINKVFTTAQLVTVTGNPLLWDVPSLTLTTDEASKPLMAGWRKKTCRVQDVANGQRQMIEVWQLAKWSTRLYQPKV